MSDFKAFLLNKTLLTLLVLVSLLTYPSRYGDAFDGSIRVYESTFNEFGAATQPIQVTGRYKFKVTINAGIFGTHTITVCDSAYTASVTNLVFDITPSNVIVDGDVNANWCGIPFGGDVDAVGTVYYTGSDKTVRFSFSSASVQPSFSISFWHWTYTVWIPVHINIAPTLNIPPLPVRTAPVSFETAGGRRDIFMSPRDVSLRQRDGYIELQGNIVFW